MAGTWAKIGHNASGVARGFKEVSVFLNERLKQLRESKNLSQGDIERKTGLLRCYISRVENGHTVPSLETLEKMARALQLPLYQIFYDGDEQPVAPHQVAPRHNAQWRLGVLWKRFAPICEDSPRA